MIVQPGTADRVIRRPRMARQGRHPLNRAEVRALTVNVARWLELIERGELEAPASMVRHLEGAVTALRAVLGELGSPSLDSIPSIPVQSSHGEAQEAQPGRPE